REWIEPARVAPRRRSGSVRTRVRRGRRRAVVALRVVLAVEPEELHVQQQAAGGGGAAADRVGQAQLVGVAAGAVQVAVRGERGGRGGGQVDRRAGVAVVVDRITHVERRRGAVERGQHAGRAGHQHGTLRRLELHVAEAAVGDEGGG